MRFICYTKFTNNITLKQRLHNIKLTLKHLYLIFRYLKIMSLHWNVNDYLILSLHLT